MKTWKKRKDGLPKNGPDRRKRSEKSWTIHTACTGNCRGGRAGACRRLRRWSRGSNFVDDSSLVVGDVQIACGIKNQIGGAAEGRVVRLQPAGNKVGDLFGCRINRNDFVAVRRVSVPRTMKSY